MQNIFIEFLPPWVETGLQPAFYDKESGTVLQQTARMYAKINELIKSNNKLYTDFIELKEYVDNFFDSTDFQELVDNKLDEMYEDGTLGALIAQYIDDNYVTKTDYATSETGGVIKVGDDLEIENGTLNIKPFEDFIQDVDFHYVRYQGEGGYTNVYYAIIPAEYKPTLKLANNHLDDALLVSDMAYANKATIATNAGVMDVSTNETYGPLVVDGEFMLGQNHTFSIDRETLYMSSNGRLEVIPYTSTQEEIMSLNPVWAVTAFVTFVQNYQKTPACHSGTDYAERTVIGQDADGNYLIFVTGGRGIYDVGFNPLDCYNFAISVNFNPRILYNLDGGGSSTMVYHGITMNQLAGDTGLTRKVPNTICWISPSAKTQAIWDSAKTVNDALIAERRTDIPTNLKPNLTPGENVTISNLSVYGEGSFVYLEGYITTSAEIANYGRICEGMPAPAVNTAYVNLYDQSNKEIYTAYVAQSTGYMNNANLEPLPAGTYYIRSFYRIPPTKTLDSSLD